MASANAVLIVTAKLDPHADAVITELRKLGREVFRLNTEDLLKDYTVEIETDSAGELRAGIADRWGREINLPGDITSCYYRKPEPVEPPETLSEPGACEFARDEAIELLRNFYAFPGLKWVNNYQAIQRARLKLPQLALAGKLGLNVPRTIVTTNPHQARLFARSCPNGVACKPLYVTTVTVAGEPRHLFTSRLNADAIEEYIESVAFAPTLLQEYIPKRMEIRATIIGDKVYACEIDSQALYATSTDWRQIDPFEIHHRPIELPGSVTDALITLSQSMKLAFGAADLIETPGGEYVFLENNPNGQWYWIELMTGMPLARAMAELLSNL